MTTTQTRTSMIALLKKGKCRVKFKKSDKTKTERIFTLNKDLIVSEEIIGKLGGDNKEVITVWDLEKKAWRSFRVDSVLKDITLIV